MMMQAMQLADMPSVLLHLQRLWQWCSESLLPAQVGLFQLQLVALLTGSLEPSPLEVRTPAPGPMAALSLPAANPFAGLEENRGFGPS